MIVIISDSATERSAISALCASRGWSSTECDSFRAAKKTFVQLQPRVIVTRQKLTDGFSDDVLKLLAARGGTPAARSIVLLSAMASSDLAARQLSLGADTVHRDPVRADVLLEYISKYRQPASGLPTIPGDSNRSRTFQLAGASIDPIERRLTRGSRHVSLTPREVQLAELLFESCDEVVTYGTLYSEILGRRFNGDTANMRVLFGRLDCSFRSLGLGLRPYVDVIAKTGYRYQSSRARQRRQLTDSRPRSR